MHIHVHVHTYTEMHWLRDIIVLIDAIMIDLIMTMIIIITQRLFYVWITFDEIASKR